MSYYSHFLHFTEATPPIADTPISLSSRLTGPGSRCWCLVHNDGVRTVTLILLLFLQAHIHDPPGQLQSQEHHQTRLRTPELQPVCHLRWASSSWQFTLLPKSTVLKKKTFEAEIRKKRPFECFAPICCLFILNARHLQALCVLVVLLCEMVDRVCVFLSDCVFVGMFVCVCARVCVSVCCLCLCCLCACVSLLLCLSAVGYRQPCCCV